MRHVPLRRTLSRVFGPGRLPAGSGTADGAGRRPSAAQEETRDASAEGRGAAGGTPVPRASAGPSDPPSPAGPLNPA